jgi:endogenous inhibitor of DNA gyrase (YacG/DUF329 family)
MIHSKTEKVDLEVWSSGRPGVLRGSERNHRRSDSMAPAEVYDRLEPVMDLLEQWADGSYDVVPEGGEEFDIYFEDGEERYKVAGVNMNRNWLRSTTVEARIHLDQRYRLDRSTEDLSRIEESLEDMDYSFTTVESTTRGVDYDELMKKAEFR